MAEGIADLLEVVERQESLAAERNSMKQDVEDAISSLPPLDEQIFRLRYYRGYAFSKIGNELHVSSNIAQRRYNAAMDSLQKRLNASEDECYERLF